MKPDTQDSIFESLETLSQAGDYYKWLAARMRPFIRGKVLEIGAGIGNFAQWAKESATEYHVSDIDERVTTRMIGKFDRVLNWDVYTPFPGDEKYDTIVILNVVEHLEDDLKALQCIHDRLKPGGHLVLMVPAMQFLFGSLDTSFGHYRRYTRRSIGRLIQGAKFNLIKTEYVNVVGMAGWFLYGKILKRKNLPQELCGRFNLVIPLLRLERPIAHFFGLSVIAIGQKT
jgi:2-polyprenyl-3-methyl-5-hydroxy-6-metoxy-1,4-benzoquinol methylase